MSPSPHLKNQNPGEDFQDKDFGGHMKEMVGDRTDPKLLVLLYDDGISEYTIYTHKPTGKLMVPLSVYQLVYQCGASMYWPDGMPNQLLKHRDDASDIS
jgi:hypothetical protein